MQNALYVSLSKQVTLRREMDVIANNLANVATPSYKADRIMFAELVAGQAPYPAAGAARGGRLSFVNETGMLRDVSDGALTETGNSLDLAINGSGYFTVETPGGPRYTRQGGFRLDSDGRIVTSEGFALLDTNGRPLAVPPGESRIEISPQGAVMTEGGEIGRIRLVTFENEQALHKLGSGLYESELEPLAANPATEIRQGMIEGSNVKAVTEVTSMMEILRRYQSAQKMIDSEHELQRRAIDKLSRVS